MSEKEYKTHYLTCPECFMQSQYAVVEDIKPPANDMVYYALRTKCNCLKICSRNHYNVFITEVMVRLETLLNVFGMSDEAAAKFLNQAGIPEHITPEHIAETRRSVAEDNKKKKNE